jgi:cytochrome c-type biogenesis protein CcmF
MLIHPPTLLLGLASTSIPFAISLGMIISKTSNIEWSRSLRRWTLISLLILSAGNFLGAWWAYTVLGWGGYWGWDPVENCAILPLIPLAMLLHSKPLQERLGLFYTWNLMLGCLPFVLAIFGTFNVRSGLITSVHSFAESDIGPYFLGLLAVTLLTPAILLTLGTRVKSVTHNYDSVLSRETGLIINNFLLLSIGLVILGGTLFPVASELANGARIVVGPLFFADTVGPLLTILLIFMAFTAPLVWTKTLKKNYLQQIKFPISLAVLISIFAVILGANGLINLLAIFACAFGILIHSFEICRAITKNTGVALSPYDRVLQPFKRNPRRYGGYIAHIGLAVMAIGIISSTAYESRNRFTVSPGDSFALGDYSFEYQGLWGRKPEKNGIEIEAGTEVTLIENSEVVKVFRPGRRFFYAAPNQPVAIVDIDTSLIRDVYVFTQGWDEQQVAEIQILIKPLVQWLWIGAGLYIGGVLVSLSARDKSMLKNS